MTNLEDQIEKRKQEAVDKDIVGQAVKVARVLGQTYPTSDTDSSGSESVYKEKTLNIKFSCGSFNDGESGYSGVDISYGDQQVFYEGGHTIRTYIPGNWEKKLKTLFNKATKKEKIDIEKQKQMQSVKQKEADDAERKKWGL